MQHNEINIRIMILRTTIELLSSMSDGPSKLIEKAIKSKYPNVHIAKVNTIEELSEVVASKPDLCFLGMKRLPYSITDQTMVWVSDYLDTNGINYTGSQAAAIKLEFDKEAAKKAVQAAGLKTPAYFVGSTLKELVDSGLEFPLFIKPVSLGNKSGIDEHSVVHSEDEYLKKTSSLSKQHNSPALVEEYLQGKEYSVGIFQDKTSSNPTAISIEAVVPENSNGDRILVTTSSSAEAEVISVISNVKIKDAVEELAKKVFVALGARDYGRIDIRVDKNGTPHFLEANLIPGLAAASYFPIANKLNNSIEYEKTVLSIVDIALTRVNI